MAYKKSTCWLNILFIVGFGLILTVPLMVNSCLESHDFKYHLIYSKHFSEQLWHGEFYPRWLQNMNSGLGSPTFFFYAPIPYYITSLFSPLFHFNTFSCNELGVSSSVALIASGLTAYFWLKEIVPKSSAAIASIVYMAWPYHLVFDLYIRFAFAEYWSFVWMPLILYFSLKTVRGSRTNIIGLAISIALLALTHLPTFVIFFPVSVFYGLLTATRNQCRMAAIYLSLAIIIAIGLSAIYWFPALTTQSSVSMDVILTGEFDYANNFLFTGPKVAISKNFGRGLELLAGLTGGLAFCAWKISQKYKSTSSAESNYWILVSMLSLFMMLPISEFAWDILPVVQRIQFPWRFNTVLTVSTVGLFALAISQLKTSHNFLIASAKKRLSTQILYLTAISLVLTAIQIFPLQGRITFWASRNTVLSLSLIALSLLAISFIRRPIDFSKHKFVSIGFLLIITIFLGSVCYGHKRMFLNRIDDLNDVPRIEVSQGANEHRPQWVPKEIFNPGGFSRLSREFPTKVRTDVGNASYLIRQWQSREIILYVSAATDTNFTIRQFYYPGWSARLSGSLQKLPLHFSESGLIQISVPAGKHEIFITLDAVVEERIGQTITAVSAVLTLLLVFLFSIERNSGHCVKHIHLAE